MCSIVNNPNIGLDNGLALTRRQAIYLKQWWLDYRRIYASLGVDD